MCWIFAYKWYSTNADQILLQWLQRLEYRGYDSAGIYLCNDSESYVIKSVGKVSNLVNKVSQSLAPWSVSMCGIGHTRWATHGWVTVANAHPHQDNQQLFTIVHNGIIENYAKLKQKLLEKWYTFYSDTDTEVVANLLADTWDGNFLSTVEKVLPLLHGAYALVIMCRESPGDIIGVKLWSPLVFGKEKDDFYLSSDTQALAWLVSNIIYLDDWELVYIKGKNFLLKSEGREIFKNLEVLNENDLQVSKWNYKHWMLKEIFEQPNILKRVCLWRVNFSDYSLKADAFHGMGQEDFQFIEFVWCGSAHHVGNLACMWIQDLAGIRSSSHIASEYEYQKIWSDPRTLHVFVSQSGETADTLQVLKTITTKGGPTFGIVNVVGSSISRMTNNGLFIRAWSEIGVATTKAFSAQALCALLLWLYLGSRRELWYGKIESLVTSIQKLPSLIDMVLDESDAIRKIAQDVVSYHNLFFLWRHYLYPIAQECSLKFKEISYIHSEAFASWELKHGQLALVDKNFLTVLLMPDDGFFTANLSTMHEVKAREGKVLTISDKPVEGCDWHISIPSVSSPELYPFLVTVVGQLLAYHVADLLGRDIDKPRNLAKSVTVK